MPASRRQSKDAIAREAARLLALGRATDLDEAVALARQASDTPGQPSRTQVRRHIQAMSMQSMGEAAYRQRTRDLLTMAEEIMTALEQGFPDARTLLVGRAAEGHFDADPSIHIRIMIDASTADIAAVLWRLGYQDTDFAFTTMDTASVGRLSQIEWVENDARVVITRCTSAAVFESRDDLVTRKPLAVITLQALGDRLRQAN